MRSVVQPRTSSATRDKLRRPGKTFTAQEKSATHTSNTAQIEEAIRLMPRSVLGIWILSSELGHPYSALLRRARACVAPVLSVMPLTRFVVDALGVVTICFVAPMVLLSLSCILCSFYFCSHIHSHGFIRLDYFSGPWIIRITSILLARLWGIDEIARLNSLRLDKPCLFLTLGLLLHTSLQKTESEMLSQK
ncbi:hypothetical protein U1Q18_027126 [Sarracenia purpurea var. burkii]